MPIHNKLVRDRIPEIIEKSGEAYHTRILNETEYREEVRQKMKEELDEYLGAQTDEEALEELADLLELIHAASRIHGADVEKLEAVRQRKAEKRGRFEEKIDV
ncbi:nucleoside triphosphate pyrophosphohydrolase [Bacillus thermotolerans]|uniref:Phosphoribosyl-ATP pyrophosphohydrolase n=1 Tax=Bacillus thermotolerans TaxID=1221996 RepID=A0A0F5I808_BACTR|nr:nucleoside triphosphate pyrophosphohydrolase [Bacillus thermotolerans]KKB41764.1 hypothetical protein QY95_00571 [Bacillus thermotolerans]KKB44344.1 hypothetical protein QY96_02944 [Bacillus thermotolerans]